MRSFIEMVQGGLADKDQGVPGPVLLSSGLRRSPDELLYFPSSGMKNASSSI